MTATATELRTEARVDPLGIGETQPSLRWWMRDDRPGARQTAYRVRVASSPDLLPTPDLWDSGRVGSDATSTVYGGSPLTSRQRAVWDVTVWDADGTEGTPSQPATFEVGLLDRSDWMAEWIATPIAEAGMTTTPAPLLRKEFDVAGEIVRARLHVTALGIHVTEINGAPVTDAWFRPGWTDYGTRIPVETYDVTGLVGTGANAIGTTLGDGWFSGRVGWHERGYYGDRPAFLAQLEIDLADGTTTTVVTDGTWQWALGPVRRQDLIEGEEYDARHEIPGWSEPGLSPDAAARFEPVEVLDGPAATLTPTPAGPVRAVEEFAAVGEPNQVNGGASRLAFHYDLGQNFTGVVRIRVKGPRGATVRLRYAEMLDDDGNLYTANLRSARCIDYYTLKGDPDGETFTPRFTFHGFRHVELSYVPKWAHQFEHFDATTVTGVALSSAVVQTGRFECSDDRLNRLQSNIRWGLRSNFLEVPTDCPQRDERLGWTGDAQVFAPTAVFNDDVEAFFEKWSRDLDDAQQDDGRIPSVVPNVLGPDDGGPGWSDARVLCAWAVYEAYGNRAILERHYQGMVRWIDWQAQTATDGIRCADDCGYFQGYSDWLSLDSTWQNVWSATPRDFIGTACFARTAGVMADIATLLGHDDDATRFGGYRAEAVEAWNRRFVENGAITVATQTAHLMALAWDLLPEGHRDAAFARLLELLEERDWHLSTGFLGTPLICPVLTSFGRTDLAYRIFLQQDYPGWLFPVRNGATTMWERWNSWTPDAGFGDVNMNSFNHYAYGAIGRWMYDTIAGLALDPDRPGYRHVRIAPQPGGGLTWANATLRSLHGPIATNWTLDNGRFTLTAQLPPNTTATVTLPDGTTYEFSAGAHTLACAI